MIRRILTIILVIALAGTLAGCRKDEPSEEAKPQILGKSISQFSAENLDGETVTDAVLQEHVVNMVFLWGTG